MRWPTKERRRKALRRRELRVALRASKRELGDHRRWWWVATMPFTAFDPVFGCDTEVIFDPKYGRCFRPLVGFGAKVDATDEGAAGMVSDA